jgi:hypothetical protein
MTWPLADQTIQLHNLAVELALATMGAECVTNVVWIRVWTFQQIKNPPLSMHIYEWIPKHRIKGSWTINFVFGW